MEKPISSLDGEKVVKTRKQQYQDKFPRHTFYVPDRDVETLRDIKHNLRKAKGEKVDISGLVREAIKDVIQKYKEYT